MQGSAGKKNPGEAVIIWHGMRRPNAKYEAHQAPPAPKRSRSTCCLHIQPQASAASDNGSSYIAGDLADWLEDRDMMAIACHSPEKSKLKIPKSVACEFNRADTGRHKRPKTGLNRKRR